MLIWKFIRLPNAIASLQLEDGGRFLVRRIVLDGFFCMIDSYAEV